MIKAKKGLLITLFAAMMVFAFGATSAFASAPVDGDWATDYSTVTYNKVTYSTIRTIDSDGVIKAVADTSDYDDPPTIKPVYYYDFTGAGIAIKGNYSTQASFTTALGQAQDYVVFATPSYVANAKTAESTYTALLKGWRNKVTSDLDEDNPAAQVVTVTGKVTSKGEAQGIENSPYAFNKADLTKSVNVGAVAGETTFWKDATNKTDGEQIIIQKDHTEPVEWTYDGKDHKVVNTVADDHSVTWAVLNESTGRYDAATECPSVKNVADTYTVKATDTYEVKVDKTTTIVEDVYKFVLTVKTTDHIPYWQWTAGNGTATYDYEVTSEQAADPSAFIDFDNRLAEGNDADLDTLKALFAARYDIVVTNNEIDSNLQTWTVDPKELTPKEIAALAKEYQTLQENYSIDKSDMLLKKAHGTSYSVTVKVIGNPVLKVDDINFVEAPNATYHVKKAKKLKKNKSFTVQAVADSGNVVSYKIDSPSKKITIDSATGKVTVAKGLKKGTYKVTIKAKTDAGNGYQACMVSRDLTIKIKK